MSGIGYVRRDKDSQVDWSSMTNSMVNEMGEIQRERENQRQKLQDFNDQAVRMSQEVELGDSVSINEFVMDAAEQQKEYLLMRHKLLKQGLIKPSEYARDVQRQMDGIKSFANTTKNINAKYQNLMERLSSGKMNPLEEREAEDLLKMLDFKGKKYMVNPDGGDHILASIDENGNIIDSPDSRVSVKSLENFSLRDRVYVDVLDEARKFTDKIGERIKVIMKNGVLTRSEILNNEEYKEARDTHITSLVSNDDALISTLGNYLGVVDKDSFTFNPEETDKILLKVINGEKTYDWSRGDRDKWEEQARTGLNSLYDSSLDLKETPMPIFAPQREPAPPRSTGRSQSDVATNIASMYYGDENEVRSAMNFFLGQDDITDIKRDSGGLTVTKDDGSFVRIPFKDSSGREMSVEQFIESAVNQLGGGVTDLNKALSEARIDRGRGLSDTATSAKIDRPERPVAKSLSEAVVRVGTSIKSGTDLINSMPIGNDPRGSLSEVMDTLGFEDFGIDFDTDWSWLPGVDKKVKIRIRNNSGGITEESISYYPSDKEKSRANITSALSALYKEIVAKKNNRQPSETGSRSSLNASNFIN